MAQTDTDSVQRVRIYLSRNDQWEGGPLYLAVMEELRRAGATGATAMQGIAGFGPGQRTRAGGVDRPDQHQPVIIEWIDRVERVARVLPLLDALVRDALVTVENIPVYRAVLRASGPFASDRSVGDAMRRDVTSTTADAPLSEALELLHAATGGVLPVLDETGRLVGLISEQELAWRVGLRLPLRLLAELTPAERDALLAPLVGRTVREVMSMEPRTVGASTAIAQALVTMVEWGYAAVPVIDRAGRVVGMLGQSEVLRAAIEQATAADGAPEALRDAEPPTPVRLVMQTVAPTVAAGTRLDQALAQLLGAPERRLLVVDGAGRLVGTLDDAAVLRQLAPDERGALLAAMQRAQPAAAAHLPGAERGLDELVEREPPTVAPDSTIVAAAQRLLELEVERLPVVDDEQRLLGIIARGGLVRALMQQSE